MANDGMEKEYKNYFDKIIFEGEYINGERKSAN